MKWQYIPFRESILILRMQSSSRCVSQVHQAIMKWNFKEVEGHRHSYISETVFILICILIELTAATYILPYSEKQIDLRN